MSPFESFTIGLRAPINNVGLIWPWTRQSLNIFARISENMSGADFRQSDVNSPYSSDLSLLNLEIAFLTRSAVNKLIESLEIFKFSPISFSISL